MCVHLSWWAHFSFVNGALTKINYGDFAIQYTYDDYGRVTGRILSSTATEAVINEQYSYADGSTVLSHRPNVISIGTTTTYQGVYDNMGNISLEGAEFGSARYQYDGLNRLSREDNPTLNVTRAYTYDKNGNITTVQEGAFTTDNTFTVTKTKTYTYDTANKDRLLSVSDGSETFTVGNYDLCGNPCNYGANVLEWSRGKQLTKFGNVEYEYNGYGVRQKKHYANGQTRFYFLEGTKILEEMLGVEGMDVYPTFTTVEGTRIVYRYDAQGVAAMEYDGGRYYYRKNLCGDIIALLDQNFITVAKYAYDAWGNHKVYNADGTENMDASFIGNINPFRYRGYYYDTESGLYYLQTRYYDPKIGRFLNMDTVDYLAPGTLNGCNLYAYCNNNPVMYVDPSGLFPIAALLIGIGIGALFGGITAGISSALDGNTNWALVGDILGGALIGGATGAAFTLGGLAGLGMIGTKAAIIGFSVSTVASFGAGVGANVLQSSFRGEDIDWNEAWQDGAFTAIQSAVCFWVGASMSSGGMWTSLNTKAYSSSIRLFKSVGQNGLRSFANGTLLYFEMFGKDIMIRTGVKFLYTYLWSYLRNNN